MITYDIKYITNTVIFWMTTECLMREKQFYAPRDILVYPQIVPKRYTNISPGSKKNIIYNKYILIRVRWL